MCDSVQAQIMNKDDVESGRSFHNSASFALRGEGENSFHRLI